MIKYYKTDREKSGFTLIELLIVVVILGVLATLVIVNTVGARQRATDLRKKTDLAEIKKALRMYYNDYNRFPAANTGRIEGCSVAYAFDWGTSFGCPGASPTMTYMSRLPINPSFVATSTHYQYTSSSTQSFCLWVDLENSGDAQLTESQARCGTCVTVNSIGHSGYVVCED